MLPALQERQAFRARTRAAAAAISEIALALIVLAVAARVGDAAGWSGTPHTSTATRVWPFYIDTWDTRTVWTARALFPIAAIVPVVLVLRAWLRRGGVGWLIALVAAAYVVQLGCGLQRYGVDGLGRTFSRWQEYWQDTPYVSRTFLARFPEVEGPLSPHGKTHPPGYTLVLAGIRSAGATDRKQAEVVCSLATPLAALAFFGMARRFTDERTARCAVPLFLFASSITAFTILSVDMMTVLLAAVSLYGLSRALDGDVWGGALWGAAFAAASLGTFLSLALAITYGVLVLRRQCEGKPPSWVALACGPAAFVAFYAVVMVGFGYRPFHVFAAGMRAYAVSDDALYRSRWVALVGNPIAFVGALGLPLAALAARSLGGTVLRLGRAADRSTVLLMAAAFLPPALCTCTGTPRGEVEHVFLLFVPMAVLAVADAARRWYGRTDEWLWALAVPSLIVQSVLVEVFFETYW